MLCMAIALHCLDHNHISGVPELACSESHVQTLYGQLHIFSCEQLYVLLVAAMQ